MVEDGVSYGDGISYGGGIGIMEAHELGIPGVCDTDADDESFPSLGGPEGTGYMQVDPLVRFNDQCQFRVEIQKKAGLWF